MQRVEERNKKTNEIITFIRSDFSRKLGATELVANKAQGTRAWGIRTWDNPR